MMKYRTAALLTLVFVLSLPSVQTAEGANPSLKDKPVVSKRQAKKRAKKKAKPNPAFRTVRDDPKLPRVLLIGDSISIGYTVPVQKLLKGKANVHRIPVNGGDTARGLKNIDAWLGDKPWDVIHFNWGLHDLKRWKNGKIDASGSFAHTPEEYAKNLDALVRRLKKTGATLIWATTTPVPKGSHGRVHGDAVVYNRAAARVMAKHGVKTNDLYALVMPQLSKAQRPKNVHFFDKGSTLLGEQVARAITDALNDRTSTRTSGTK